MSIPKHLKEKPILGVYNYESKVFRHIGKKWSRQSEELPLHRVLDLKNLILSAYLQKQGN